MRLGQAKSVSGVSQSAGREATSQIEKRNFEKATPPEADKYRLLLRRINRHSLKFHTSVAAGRERPVKSNEKLMNVEHRTSNIEHRIMYSVYFKK